MFSEFWSRRYLYTLTMKIDSYINSRNERHLCQIIYQTSFPCVTFFSVCVCVCVCVPKY
ncbi:hypothetical protein M426DRAFT_247046 [Hypoxylon sp. CI-4A]|nr:hypothetical protein M426DRAFT_247046 [Hypoxylon sp. CI-4A]